MTMLSREKGISDQIPTSSMADIAFLLLVFFLVTTVFPKDRGLALVLPDGEAPVSAGNIVHFLVSPSGSVGVRWGESQQTQLVEADEVGAVWRTGVSQNPRLIAAVRTDPSAEYGRMIDVLDQLKTAGAQRVTLQSGN